MTGSLLSLVSGSLHLSGSGQADLAGFWLIVPSDKFVEAVCFAIGNRN